MSSRKPVLITLISAVAIGAIATAWVFGSQAWEKQGPDAFGLNEIATNGNVQGDLYPGDPVEEARLVALEDERLVYIRTVASAARWRVDGLEGPYRIRTGAAFTLVLPARDVPYTVADLITLAPDTFIKQVDGSYLLLESIAVLPGATLSLESPEGIDLRMKSDVESFVSIVTLGGSLNLGGSEADEAKVTSWNALEASVDTTTEDGRAYIRVIGGHASLSHAQFSHLGFWSGNTGGLALTGTDTISTIDADITAPPAVGSTPVNGARILPEEELSTLSTPVEEDYSIVSAGIDHVTVISNAFGLFVTNAEDVVVRDTQVSESLVDGIVLHRHVSDTTISRTTSSDNNVDGFSLNRSSTNVAFRNVTAEDNGRNGMSLDGQALADGPNAVGTGVRTYGHNRISSSTIIDNGRYGIELSGGDDLEVVTSTIAKNDVGIVVNHGAADVDIVGNTFEAQRRQSVAVRDGVESVTVARNSIVGGDTGIYVRNADASVIDNTLTSISNHGISLVGDVTDTRVIRNSVAGYGSIAIWAETSIGGIVDENDLLDWRPATTFETIVNSVFQPLTFVWLLLASLLVASAFTRKRQLKVRTIRSPYAERVPLTSLSPGIVSLDGARGTK